jgi:spore coat protein A
MGILVGAGISMPLKFGSFGSLIAPAEAQTLLPGKSIPQFIDSLPLLDLAGGPMQTVLDDGTLFSLYMHEFQANVMPSAFVPADGTYGGTWVWGYRLEAAAPTSAQGTYIGPVIVARRGTPTNVTYVNNLGMAPSNNLVSWDNATDQTLYWADPLNNGANACELAVMPGQPPSPMCAAHYVGPVPGVVHLHGGEVPATVDGGPNAWFTSDGAYHGFAYYSLAGGTNSATYQYPNSQEAAMIWFHDHVLGITRLNVYAGLAGAYVLTDPGLSLPPGLNPVGLQQGTDASTVDYIIPIVLQDRSFDVNGQFFFPNAGDNPEHPYWVPEFVGDTIVVNGKVWPFLNVEPRRYRFLFLNGSNARAYEMFFPTGLSIWQIGTDGGYLDAPVQLNAAQKLVLMPGERADVIIDFAGFENQTLILRNTGHAPFPGGAPPNGSTLGRIMQFRVGSGPVADASYNPASGTPLRTPMIRLVNPATGTLAAGVTVNKIRQLTLNEVLSPAGEPLEVLLNNTHFNGKDQAGNPRSQNDFTAITLNGKTDYYSELPNEGDTELWEIVNLTADAHPIHTHLTQFQLLNRQNFNTNKYNKAYNAAFPGGIYSPAYGPPLNYNTGNTRALGGNPDITAYLQGPVRPPEPNEAGWKDTLIMYPGQVTRIVVRYAPTDKPINDPNLYYPFDPDPDGYGFMWHCHILDHEDNEMMRPLHVNPKPGVHEA